MFNFLLRNPLCALPLSSSTVAYTLGKITFKAFERKASWVFTVRRKGRQICRVVSFYSGISFGKFIEEVVFGSGGYF